MVSNVPAISGVYLITDEVNGFTYVGASKDIRQRMHDHFYRLRAGAAHAPYRQFRAAFLEEGVEAFDVMVLERCPEEQLPARELHWMNTIKPTANQKDFCVAEKAFTEGERQRRSDRTKKLWATPEYRARASKARQGNTFAKGHRCTPEQVENRRRAARLSNMKRNYGDGWRDEYVRRYPEHAGDV